MQITEADWTALAPHVTHEGRQPPRKVYATVAALVDPATIHTSHSHYEPNDGSTSWHVIALTPTAIVEVLIEFDSERYDRDEEDDRYNRNRKIGTTIKQAWARALSSVIEYSIASVGTVAASSTPSAVSVAGVLRFADGKTLTLPDPATFYSDKRARVDELHVALRAAVPWSDAGTSSHW